MQATRVTILGKLQRMQRFMDTDAETLTEINASRYRQILADDVGTLSNKRRGAVGVEAHGFGRNREATRARSMRPCRVRAICPR
jgi:hypothetical protein